MPIDVHQKRMPPRPEEIIAEQKADAAKRRAATDAIEEVTGTVTAVVPAKPTSTALALPDTRTPVQMYLDEVAPANVVGRLVKFTKEGVFATADDDGAMSEDAEFVALTDETQVGWIKFNGEGTPPDRIMGLLYDGFQMPSRASLGDSDEAEWPEGLSGKPSDPWLHQMNLVLQHAETRELYTFSTTSITGRRAVGNLLRHYNRMTRTNPGEIPVIKLKVGGFNHRDERIGWVSTPVFAVVGRVPRDSAAKPDTSVAGDMNDSIPF
jgi:hypothetical protein